MSRSTRTSTRYVFADGSVHDVPNSYRPIGDPGELVIIGSDAQGNFVASFPLQGGLPPDCYRENAVGIERGDYIEAEGVLWAKAPDFTSLVQPAVGPKTASARASASTERGQITRAFGGWCQKHQVGRGAEAALSRGRSGLRASRRGWRGWRARCARPAEPLEHPPQVRLDRGRADAQPGSDLVVGGAVDHAPPPAARVRSATGAGPGRRSKLSLPSAARRMASSSSVMGAVLRT